MFTGITIGCGRVCSLEPAQDSLHIGIAMPDSFWHRGRVDVGASVSCNGTCLTVVKVADKIVYFDAITETLARTNLSAWQIGTQVNIERAMLAGDEVGGHFVSGHIMDSVSILKMTSNESEYSLKLATTAVLADYVLEKGYVACNGCSLTIGQVDDTGFWVHLIPETLRVTNFSQYNIGDKINIEIDALTQAAVTTTRRFLSSQKL